MLKNKLNGILPELAAEVEAEVGRLVQIVTVHEVVMVITVTATRIVRVTAV